MVVAARRLLGCLLVRDYKGQRFIGRIVETEAYHQSDAASHSYRGQTPRTSALFGLSGHAYVYFTYGLHYCVNVVTGPSGEGSAVLIRAIEPLEGGEAMSHHRHGVRGAQMTNGPAKLCQAMAIDKSLNGHNLQQEPLQLWVKTALQAKDITTTTRIGITKETQRLQRFYITGNAFISKP